MINILVLDDNPADIKKIEFVLTPLANFIDYEVHSFLTLQDGQNYLQNNVIDLLLLDLEFADQKETSIYFLEHLNPSLPVIILSNLTHYQRQLSLRANVFGFLPKVSLSETLVNSILELFSSQNFIRKPSSFIFPSPRPGIIAEEIPIKDILCIEVITFQRYNISLRSGNTIQKTSVAFKDLCKAIKDQHIEELHPISRNQIINLNYIKEIYQEKNGRIVLSLIGINHEFHVGINETGFFKRWYLE